MKNSNRLIIAVLAVMFFTSGYAARNIVKVREDRVAQERARAILTDTRDTRVASTSLVGAGDIDLRPLETLLSVVNNLREHYVEQITVQDEGKMTHDAVKTMLRSLKDPNTRFLDPKERAMFSDALEGKFHGIGAWLGVKQIKSDDSMDEHLIVIAPLPGSPAEKAGLKPGDDIIEINGKSVLPIDPFKRIADMLKENRSPKVDRVALQKKFEKEQKRITEGIDIIDAEDMLNSTDSKNVDLTVLPRGADKTVKITVQPADFILDPITSAMESGFGYIRINCFCANTPASFDQAMRDLGDKQAKGLILDLRNIAGGDMDIALKIARWFAPGKVMTTVERSRSRRVTLKIPTDSAVQTWKKPVVVLVNRGTAETAEVLASALKDNKVARLIGEMTYGDFAETTMIDESDGSAIVMTTGKYLSVSGADRGKSGLIADIAASRGTAGDGQLDEAVKVLGE